MKPQQLRAYSQARFRVEAPLRRPSGKRMIVRSLRTMEAASIQSATITKDAIVDIMVVCDVIVLGPYAPDNALV